MVMVARFRILNRAIRALQRRWRSWLEHTHLTDAIRKLGFSQPSFSVVIAMPGSVHLAAVALGFLRTARPTQDVLLILNGCSPAERSFLRTCSDKMKATMITTRKAALSHDVIIDLLVRWAPSDFWLIDHDCLVLDGTQLLAAEESVRLNQNVGASFFADPIEGSSRLKPHTFLLFVNRKQMLLLFQHYRMGSKPISWERIPKRARRDLALMGFSSTQSPEPQKPFWDTLSAIFMLAEMQGCGMHLASTHSAWFSPHSDAVHFGNTSHPWFQPFSENGSLVDGWGYRVIGAYFWRVCLDLLPSFSLRSSYLSKYPQLADRSYLHTELSLGGVPLSTITFIDELSLPDNLNQSTSR